MFAFHWIYDLNTFDDVEYKYYNGTWRYYSLELKVIKQTLLFNGGKENVFYF